MTTLTTGSGAGDSLTTHSVVGSFTIVSCRITTLCVFDARRFILTAVYERLLGRGTASPSTLVYGEDSEIEPNRDRVSGNADS